VLAPLSQRDLVPEIWLPDPAICRERELTWPNMPPRCRRNLRLRALRRPGVDNASGRS
jgi:hypothetical protein